MRRTSFEGLTRLVDEDVLERVPFQHNPPRWEYRLTGKGGDLWQVPTAMRQWGDRWAAPKGPPLQVRHDTCGHVVGAVFACSHCGETLGPRSLKAESGPGATPVDLERNPLANGRAGTTTRARRHPG